MSTPKRSSSTAAISLEVSDPRLQINRLDAPRALAQAATFAAWPPAAKRIVAGVSESGASGRSGRTSTSSTRSPIVEIDAMAKGCRIGAVETWCHLGEYRGEK